MINKWNCIPNGDVLVYDDSDADCRHQIRRMREWAPARRLTLLPASDPRALVWFGASEATVPAGGFYFFGANGVEAQGQEALARALHALPSGCGRMLAELLGDEPCRQGDPAQAVWDEERDTRQRRHAFKDKPGFDSRGQLKHNTRMGN
jgi:hypothetical protein